MIVDLRCEKCGRKFGLFLHDITDAEESVPCPECQVNVYLPPAPDPRQMTMEVE